MASRTTAAQHAMESTATKAPGPTATKALATEDVFEQFDRIYDSIAQRAFEDFLRDGYRSATIWNTGIRRNPNCCTQCT